MMNPKTDKLMRRTTIVATAVASYFLLTADYGPEPNALDPVCLFQHYICFYMHFSVKIYLYHQSKDFFFLVLYDLLLSSVANLPPLRVFMKCCLYAFDYRYTITLPHCKFSIKQLCCIISLKIVINCDSNMWMTCCMLSLVNIVSWAKV